MMSVHGRRLAAPELESVTSGLDIITCTGDVMDERHTRLCSTRPDHTLASVTV